MAEQESRAHINAAIIAGVVGLVWLIGIWIVLVFPPQVEAVAPGGEQQILTGTSINLVMQEWGFNQKRGAPIIEIKAGTEVTFTVVNQGRNLHSFQILTPDGEHVAGWTKDEVIDVGETRTLTVVIDEPGEYIYICPVEGHEDKGMKGILRVVS